MTSYPQETTDTNLVQLTAEGNAEAFTALYDRHSTLVFSIALKILGNREEASDVLQQVFLRLHHKACLYTPENGRPASWLAAITRNQCLDRLRQMKSRRSLGEKLCFEATVAAHPRHPGGGYASYSDEVDLLHGAIAALRPEEIRVLHLAYFGALSQTEISFKLAQPLGSIKARIRRALAKLRASLEGIVEQHSASPEVLRGNAPMPV